MGDESRDPAVSQAGVWAAFLLAQARNGHGECDETELLGLVAAAGGPGEAARGAAFLIGALGQAMRDRTLAGFDAADVVAATIERVRRSEIITPAALPLIAVLLTAGLMNRMDPVAVLDDTGARGRHLVPAVEVLAALLDLVDAVSGIPGVGVDTVTAALTGIPDTAPNG